MSQKKNKNQPEDLLPVEEIARARDLPSWETAALMAATGWAPGKQVTNEAFDEALTLFRNRPQGGGRI
ncbi:MAG: hypothetical protein A2X49_15370 [Lentisphaerae bacterium GWF2_52_8]|nr:MAG: hypothetical protein A2X49_15370 [Lentisphaerae bacterium GWF2_52_8]